MGNVCRSPIAEGVFRKMVRDAGLEDIVQIGSAGTHAYHVGEPPDVRGQQAARVRDQLALLKEQVFGSGGVTNVVPLVSGGKAA